METIFVKKFFFEANNLKRYTLYKINYFCEKRFLGLI